MTRVLPMILGGLIAVWPVGTLLAQQVDSTAATPTELLRQLRVWQEAHREELDRLRAEIEDLELRLAETSRQAATSPPRAANVFNPGLTVFGNFVGRHDSKAVTTAEGDRIDNRLNLREVEIDARAAIDPWADGLMIVAVESEIPNQFEAGIEEGYVTLKKLPVLNLAPWGLKVRAGRYRPEFGRFNRIHTHDLPQTTRPLSLQTFLGEEGFIQNGISASFFLPTPGTANSLEATLDLLNGGDLPVAEENQGASMAYLGRLKWFWDLASGHDLELGASVYLGKAGADGRRTGRLHGLDLTYKWKPLAQGEWHSFVMGGEFFRAEVEIDSRERLQPQGFYAWAQYQFNRRTYLGGRYDHTELLHAPEAKVRTWGAFLSYYTTEFLRARLGYEHSRAEDGDGRLGTAFFELNFVFGSHPVEPYWVNR